MKRLERSAVALAICLAALPVAAQSHWLWENPQPSGAHLTAIDGLNATTAVAVNERGEVLRYTGSGWSVEVRAVTVALRAVDHVASNVAWACGDSGQVIRNLGAGWSNVASPSSISLSAIAFKDATTGVVGSRGSGVYYTSNGGTSWSVSSGITGIIQDVSWAPGTNTFFATNGLTLFLSTDNGASFTAQTVSPSGGANTIRALAAVSASDVWVVGASGSLWRFNTATGWTTSTVPVGLPATDFVDVAVTSGSVYALGYPSVAVANRRVVAVRSAGSLFSDVSPSVANVPVWDVAPRGLFVDPTSASGDTVFIAGQAGMLLRSTNRGVAWSRNGTSGQRYFGLDFVPGSSPLVSVAAGAEGAMLVNTTGSWAEVYCVPPDTNGPIGGRDLGDVAFTGTNGLAVGINGTVCIASSANWATWTQATVPAGSPMFREVAARSSDFVAGADNGLIYFFNTAGTVTSSPDLDPNAVSGVSALSTRPSGSEVFAGTGPLPDGGAGPFYRWTTIGTSQPTLSPTLPLNHFVTDVAFLSATNGFFVTSNGVGCTSATEGFVYETTTSGTSWTRIATLGGCAGCFGWISLHPADANTLWVNGENCGARRLTRSGGTWTVDSPNPVLDAPHSVFKIRGPANDPANLWLVGGFGMVQRTRCGGSNTATCPVDSNTCTDDVCVPATGQCVKNVLGGQSCNDGTVCTSTDVCRPDAGCSGTPITCDDNNTCTSNSCNPMSGCQFTNISGACNDNNPCTNSDMCNAGSCQGVGVMCAPPNACQTGACTLDGGCSYSNVTNGTSCNDSSQCTVNDSCQAGMCVGTTLNCNDGNPCTTDSCSAMGGCLNTPTPGLGCSTGDLCRLNEVCLADAGCGGGTTINCNDGNGCTTDTCEPARGCINTNADGLTCTDSNACTENDTCSGGSCQGSSRACNDGNPCTSDGCNPSTGCTTSNVANNTPCSDSNACSLGDRCVTGVCTPTGPLTCDDNNACTNDSCDAGVGCVFQNVADNAPCTDGNACSTGDRCLMGQCQATGGVMCNDNNPCTSESCDTMTMACMFMPRTGSSCSDGNTCTTSDTCAALPDGGIGCTGTPVSCDDGNPCTVDACGASGCTNTPAAMSMSCSDGQACTSNDFCAPLVDGGVFCAGQPVTCDDSNPCTADSCNTLDGGCATTPTNQGGACSDSNACTQTDVCNGGACVGMMPVMCDDGVSCTTDSCNPANGMCQATPTSACDGGVGGGAAGGGMAGGGAAAGGAAGGGVAGGGVAGGGAAGGGAAGGGATAGGAAGGGDAGGTPMAGGSSGGGGGTAVAGGTSGVGGGDPVDGGPDRPSVFKPGCGCSGVDGSLFALAGLVAVFARRRRQRR